MIVAFDTETTGTDPFHGCRPFLITLCTGTKNYYWWGQVNKYTREVTWEAEDLYQCISILKQATTIITHNGNFDIRMLEAALWDLKGRPGTIEDAWGTLSWIYDKLEDTLVASHAVSSGDEHGLKALCEKYLDINTDDEKALHIAVKAKIQQIRLMPELERWAIAKHGHPHFPAIPKQGTEFWKRDYWLAPEQCLKYGLLDVERTWKLWRIFKRELYECSLFKVYRTRMRLLKTAYNQQSYGRHFDINTAKQLVEELSKGIENHTKKICIEAKISHRFLHEKKSHLADLIHKRLGIPVEVTTKGKNPQPATDKVTIQHYIDRYNKPALIELKKLKQKDKRKRDIQTLINWCVNSRTHSNLNVTGTRETRQSSSAPNDQNIHKQLKYLFGPPPGKVRVLTDLVNIELRIWAYNVGNKELIAAFEKGRSVHFMIMEVIFPKEAPIYKAVKDQPYETLDPELQRIVDMYGRVKNGNFARIYGATEKKTNETYHGGKNAPDYCSLIDSRFPGIKQFTKGVTKQCFTTFKNEGVFAIHTMKVGAMAAPDVKNLDKYVGGYRLDVSIAEPFTACNYYIQGTAGQIMGEAMIDWEDHPVYEGFDCHMDSQVHDGLDTEIPICEDLPKIIETKLDVIRNAGKRYIPTCDVSYKLQYHPSDGINPIIRQLILSK